MGDAQLTFNWVRAFADYLISFNFGKGVHHHSPEASSAIIPYLLRRVWQEDNDQATLLQEIGQYGTISGDIFVKVAWEPPYQDSVGVIHPPKIRILPINPAYCFPTFHPHDRTRLIEFKLKYKFWGQAADGARTMHAYVEVITDEIIREYVDDELIDERANPLGLIPVAFCPNMRVASSPWGVSDIEDLISLNREYNEKATEISDILNYHSAPVTVITGAKAQNLEKGPRKVWSISNAGAKVTNLQLETNMAAPLGFLELLKQAMHEMTGVPSGALGQAQPITNTSGAALSMVYLSMIQRRQLKLVTYTKLLKDVNALIIRYAAVYEPEWLQYNPMVSAIQLGPDQYPWLSPQDPMTYQTSVEWIDPLPMDKLLILNEQQALMAVGLQSKVGGMRALGEKFPDQKLQEVYEEQIEEVKRAAALQLIQAGANQFIMQATGMTPDGQPLVIPGMDGPPDANGNPTGMVPAVDPVLAQEIMSIAFQPSPPERADFNENPGE